MAEKQIEVSRNGGALAPWASRGDVRELDARLSQMLPGADKLNTGQRLALAQASLAHGLDPFNGEIWMIPGRGLMIGVKGLRKKAHEQVKGNYWPEFIELTDPEQRLRLRIPAGALAFECRLFDSENLRTYAESCERLLKAGIPWEAVREMVGSKPYTPGYGVLKAGENTKMEPVQCAMKRAEADAIKRRFDVPFGLTVEADNEAPAGGEWVEGTATVVDEPEPTEAAQPVTEKDQAQAEQHARDMAALYGDDEPEPAAPAPSPTPEPDAPAKTAALKIKARSKDWMNACRELAEHYPHYQTTVKGKPSGQPNVYHILAAAAKCGYTEINDGNFEPAIETVALRATQSQ